MRLKWHFIIGFFVFINCFVLLSSATSNEGGFGSHSKIYKRFRPLYGEPLKEARAARDAADMMFHDCLKYTVPSPEDFAKYHGDLSKKPRSKEEIRDYTKVISDYQDIVTKYEGTEIAAYCQLHISGAYKRQKRYGEAIKQAKKASEMFADTAYEAKAYSRIGNIYSQSLKEHEKAIEWFAKIPKPKDQDKLISEAEYDSALTSYINAQELIVRCEVLLGKGQDAAQRCNRLSQEYPEYKEGLERNLKLHLDIDMRNRFGIDREKLLDSALEALEMSEKPTASTSIELNEPRIQFVQNAATVEKENASRVSVLALHEPASQSRNRNSVNVMVISISVVTLFSIVIWFVKKHRIR